MTASNVPEARRGPGQRALLPEGQYRPELPRTEAAGGVEVLFEGEDGRRAVFDVAQWPSPEWHAPVAAVLAAHLGPAGSRRTLASARHLAGITRRFLGFLSDRTSASSPQRLSAFDLTSYLAWRTTTVQAAVAINEFRTLASLLRDDPLRSMIPANALFEVTRQRSTPARSAKLAYSEHELRVMTRVVRTDVRGICERLKEGGQALERRPPSDDQEGLRLWQELQQTARTGIVAAQPGPSAKAMTARLQLARQLFITWQDMTSLLALLVIVTGRNVETIKELPVEHRIVEGRAVQLRLTKRRRGPQRWYETVTWEIGPAGRELYTPGGLYLLIHRLCARGRQFSDPGFYWSLWRNHQIGGHPGPDDHIDPFAQGLHKHSPYLRDWHPGGITDPRTGEKMVDASGRPLRMDFQRLRKAVETRRLRDQGGHLPSAARSNTFTTMYAHYARNDPATVEWSQSILDAALIEAAALAEPGTTPRPAVRTAWTGCRDHTHHPETGSPCLASFLTCFGCANSVITAEHLPAVVSLFDTISHRRAHLNDQAWQDTYGVAWRAIREGILPRFTEAEIHMARETGTASDDLLDLVVPAWERP